MEKPSYLQVLQNNLVRIRKLLGLNQEEAGARAGMKQTQYSKLEVADFDPRISAVFRASEALEVPMYELFRDPNPDDLSDERILQRVLEMDAPVREPLMRVVEAYLKQYEATKGVHPNAAARLKELQAIRDSQKGA